MAAPSPLEITNLDPEINLRLIKAFPGMRSGSCQVGPKKYVLPVKYSKGISEAIYRFKVRPDDVWIVTFPRSGTTLTQEMIWVLANKFDFDTAKRVQLAERFPFIEFDCLFHDETVDMIINENSHSPKNQQMIRELTQPAYKILDEMPSPRFIKTHLPLSLIPQDIWASGAKVIYIARNPKDVAVSYYHLSRLWRTFDFVEGFEQFWEYFQKGQLVWTPFWPHIIEGWEKKDDPNMLFMFYENIIKDLPKSIRHVANFLGHKVAEDQVTALADHLNVKNFRSNPAVNFEHLRGLRILSDGGETFIRTGKTGQNSYFSPELLEKANKWIEENYKNTDLRFPHV